MTAAESAHDSPSRSRLELLRLCVEYQLSPAGEWSSEDTVLVSAVAIRPERPWENNIRVPCGQGQYGRAPIDAFAANRASSISKRNCLCHGKRSGPRWATVIVSTCRRTKASYVPSSFNTLKAAVSLSMSPRDREKTLRLTRSLLWALIVSSAPSKVDSLRQVQRAETLPRRAPWKHSLGGMADHCLVRATSRLLAYWLWPSFDRCHVSRSECSRHAPRRPAGIALLSRFSSQEKRLFPV